MKWTAFAAVVALAGCSEPTIPADQAASAPETPAAATAVEPAPAEGSAGDTVESPADRERTFPIALRGTWRETAGPAPGAAQCDGSANANIGKVLNVRTEGFGIFEEGGRFIAVEQRNERMIRAVFDTTYADTPTRDELTFTVDPVAKTLTVENHDPGERRVRTYMRCPG